MSRWKQIGSGEKEEQETSELIAVDYSHINTGTDRVNWNKGNIYDEHLMDIN